MQPDKSSEPALATLRHRPYEDVQALITGTLFVALGIVMFGHSGLLTGGTAGIAFLIHYATGWNFGLVFFLINLPFYGLAWRRMGRAFTLKTFAAVGLLSLFVNLLPKLVSFQSLSPAFSAVMGGLLTTRCPVRAGRGDAEPDPGHQPPGRPLHDALAVIICYQINSYPRI
ncbi:YitT family protein [Rhodoferax sp.]|uniref:YitT family protein n=1 Tax=Rhodoferax sp. TaxID=50421 RepID=UPI0034563ED4